MSRSSVDHVVYKKFVQNFVGKTERKRPCGKPRRRWEDNIEMNLKEIGCFPTQDLKAWTNTKHFFSI
jgi:hypothetical protein